MADVETRSKLFKHRGRETLREHVGELRCRWDMEDADLTDGDLFSDEVKINLYMLGTLVLNGVVGEVHGTYVVAVDERTPGRRRLEFQQQLAQPGGLGHTVGDGAVLGLRTGAEDDGLPLGGSGHQVVSQKHRVA
jgi:hypothetical protein